MFCSHCGTKSEEELKFCASCGTEFTVTLAEVESGTEISGATTATAAKSKGIIWMAAAAVAVIAVVIVGVTFFNRLGPLLTVQRSLGNFTSEVSSRFETTPLHAFELLYNNLTNGTTTVSFDFDNGWERFRGDVTVMADSRQNAASASAEFNFDGVRFDAEFMLNNRYAVARTGLLGDQFYGITYATFRDDFQSFGRHMGLDRRTMDTISDFIESLEQSINADSATEQYQHYMDVITAFIRNSDYESSRENGMTRIEFVFDDSDITRLLWDLMEAFEDDDNMRSSFDMFETGVFRDIVNEMRSGIREIERYLRGEVSLILYVGSRNRLNRMELYADLRFDGDRAQIDMVLDLGNSALDTWELEITIIDGNWTDRFSVVWDIRESNNRHTNTITFRDLDSRDSFELSSVWNSNTGAFTLGFRDDSPWGSTGSFDGVFTSDNRGGFNLSFDHDNGWERLRIDIESSNSSNILFPSNFINIDEWGSRLIDDLERAIDDLFWGW